MNRYAKLQGELEWLQATLAVLQEGRYLTVGKVEKPKGPQLLLDIAAAANSRCGCSIGNKTRTRTSMRYNE